MKENLSIVKPEKEIGAESLTIYDFLNGSTFINIPRYQREYSWEKENIKTFLNDIHKDYYLGNIISYRTEDGADIIDGQQRIITTFLILIAIRNITIDSNLKNEINNLIFYGDICKLQLSDRIGNDGIDILNYILDDEQNIPDTVKKYNEVENYFSIKSIIKDSLHSDVYQKLVNSVIVEISFTKSEIMAHEMFVNVNTKGKSLTEIEILKSQLFRYLLASEHSDLYKENWQNMLSMIPKKEYNTYVSDAYLFYIFINKKSGTTVKTSGTVKQNFAELLKLVNTKQSAAQLFDLMTDNSLENIYCPYYAIKNHDLELLKENYYINLDTSLGSISSLWKLFGEFGFEQSDILFVSLMRNKEAFIKNHINYLYTFMLYIFLYEISRSILGTSPAQYSNAFKQLADQVCNEKDPSTIKKILKGYVSDRKIDSQSLKQNLIEEDRFIKNYRTAKYIIMIVENNFNIGLTVEHFITQKTLCPDDKSYVGYLGNLIPVIRDNYKDKTVEEKLSLYKKDSVGDTSIRNFLNYNFNESNYHEKIKERTQTIANNFIEIINDSYNKLTNKEG